MTAQTMASVVAQLSDAGLKLSLVSTGGLAVAPASHLTAELRDLIRSSKALTLPATRRSHPITRWTGKNWQQPTTHTTSTAPLALRPGVAADTGDVVALAWRYGRRIASALNP